MIVTAKDLRFNVSMLFDVLSKGEDVLITYRGKAKAKLIAIDESSHEEKSDAMFGMWSDREEDVNTTVRNMRTGRTFDI
ncbi:MAG: type II toxin-antitoxin system prevent-host-death family antitoxin [Campylobacterota bacterium]|nr:type II toxin-antitoxin system prevent-host-death family antitoxin [Campylobacterota bacterium]